MSNADADRQVQEWIQGLRTFPDATEQMAVEICPRVKKVVQEAVAAQQSINGKPWEKSKTGKPILQGMANATNVNPDGSKIRITLTGVEVWHHFGFRGTPARELWDKGKLSGIKIGNAIRLGVLKVSQEWLEREGSHRGKTNVSMGTPSVDG